MMTQVRIKRPPASPRHAAARKGPVDDLLKPDFFKALADPTRLRLVACLAKCARPCSVTEVAECCSVDFSVVSRHLQLLARAGLLDAVKNGRSVSYAVRTTDVCRSLRALADALDACAAAASGCCTPGSCGCS